MHTQQSHSRRLDAPVRNGPGEPDASKDEDQTDYEHRHFVNLVTIAFLLIVAAAIIWAFKAMEDNEALQRCLNSGRRDCVKIDVPPSTGIRLPVR